MSDDRTANARLGRDPATEQSQRCHVTVDTRRRCRDTGDTRGVGRDVEQVFVYHWRPLGGGVQVAEEADQGIRNGAVETGRQRHSRTRPFTWLVNSKL